MKIFRFIIPVMVIGICAWQGKRWLDTKPEARRFDVPPVTTFVDATAVSPMTYPVRIESQGTVSARTESTLDSSDCRDRGQDFTQLPGRRVL